jgi:calcineurin-like phosphoesterase family protein
LHQFIDVARKTIAYGHSHGKLPGDPLSLPMDVGVDTHDFRPWHVDEIRAVIKINADAGEQRAQDGAFRVKRDE